MSLSDIDQAPLGGNFADWAKSLGRLAVAAALLYALFHYGIIDLKQLTAVLQKPVNFIVSVALMLAATMFASQRWRYLLGAGGMLPKFWPVCVVSSLAALVGVVLPGAASGDVTRMIWVARTMPGHKTMKILSIIIDKAMAAYGLLLISTICIFLRPGPILARNEISILALVLGGITVAVPLFLLLVRALDNWVQIANRIGSSTDHGFLLKNVAKVLLGIFMYARLPRTLLKAFGTSIVCAVLMAASIAVLVPQNFDSTLGPIDYAIALGAGMISNILPLTPGGIGIGEGAFAFICRILEDHPTAAAYGTIFLSFRLAGIVSLLFFLPALPFKRKLFHDIPVAAENHG
jgi:glycosyltransferase 2 family protein